MAALPEKSARSEEEEKHERQESGEKQEKGPREAEEEAEEEDNLSLGAEAVLHPMVNNHQEEEQLRPSRTSTTSLTSSCCSRESLLQSREPDPEQVDFNPTPFSPPGAFGSWFWWDR